MSEFRQTLEAIRLLGLGRVLYARLFYRAHMRWLHDRGRHKFKTRQIDGLQQCDWCGAFEPRGLYANTLLRDVLTVASSGQWRDRAELSIEAHPVFARVRAFLGEGPTIGASGPGEAMTRREVGT